MPKPVFARHETFYPRYNWLTKGFDAASRDSEIFVRNDAHVLLGVGKNMVRAIRYWCHAFKILEEDPGAGGRKKPSRPTEFGKFLLGQSGVDPYLEDLASLWLLHWRLLQDPCTATAWQYAFFVHAHSELGRRDLTQALGEFVKREFPDARVARSSLKKDATCILRMYGEVATGTGVTEDSIHCPFAELGLLRPAASTKAYSFRMGRKSGLPNELIAAACLEFVDALGASGNTVPISKLLHGRGSPGLAFKLTESSLYGALEAIAFEHDELDLADAAGVVQLLYAAPPRELARRLLDQQYTTRAIPEAVA